MKIVFKKFREADEASDYATLYQEDLISITFAERWWYVFYKVLR